MAETISIGTLKARIAGDPGLLLVDVRTPAEYGEVHVPQARSVPLDSLDPAALAAAGVAARDRPVHVICRTQNRAKLGAAAFEKAGFGQVVIVDGGTTAWEAAGYPVTRGAVKVISLERQVRIGAGSLVVLGVLLAWLVHPAFIALSGFVGAGLVFAGVTDFCGMGLLLARAPWNRRTAAG
ncbi:rhodanese-like domain-containing protein [Xanthobacter oligotrophicus]|uniref:rhodanese-like domain-containing protein n=1 Tax=Xanthobacter oligotrophicus TaxID=2607286 RepID=UPI0011F2AB7B|nr:rhodanese-like domain-containing protein [Xanthobacter oligotrophicus]